MLCANCRLIKEIIYTDDLGLHYCAECIGAAPLPTEAKAMEFLYATIPFKVGDRVECRSDEGLDGVGVVEGIHFDSDHYGTPIWPTFSVALEEKSSDDVPDQALYLETYMSKVGND